MADEQKARMPVPMPQRPQSQQPADKMPPINHPAVAEYVSQWNIMAHELDRLRDENRQLRFDRDVAHARIAELEHISDHERAKKEAYQRWALRFDTMTGEIAALSTQLQKEAREAAEPEPEKIEPPTSPTPEQVEAEVAAIAKKFAPKTDGSAYPSS